MTQTFGDLELAAKTKEVLSTLVRKEVEQLRPAPRYATVASLDPLRVTYSGDPTPMPVRTGSVIPSAVGQIVRIEGSPGDRYIADVVGVQDASVPPYNPGIGGGNEFPDGIVIGDPNDPNNPPVVVVPQPPAQVTGVTVTQGLEFENIYFLISWNSVPGAVSYEVELAEKLGANTYALTRTRHTVATTARIDNLQPYTEYGVRVVAVSNLGLPSQVTPWLDVSTTGDNTIPPQVSMPVLTRGATSLIVNFDPLDYLDAPDVARGNGLYEVQIDTANTFNTANLRSYLGTSSIIAFADLTFISTWYARVRAIDTSGNIGAWSNVASLEAGGVIGGHIAPEAITTDKIADLAIDGPKITSGAVTEVKLADGAVTGTKISNGSITTVKITDDAITAPKIESGAVIADKIASNAVTTIKLDASAVTADKIAANAVTAVKIEAGAVIADKIGAGAVIADKIATNAVTAVKINAGAVTTVKLDANAVTAEKIAAGQISSDKIVTAGLDAAVIKFGTMSGDRITANTLDVNVLKTSTLTSTTITLGTNGRISIGNPTTNGIWIDHNGIRAYSGGATTFHITSAGVATFSGALSAATGTFAGTLSAGINISSPSITGGTISAAEITGTVYKSATSGTASNPAIWISPGNITDRRRIYFIQGSSIVSTSGYIQMYSLGFEIRGPGSGAPFLIADDNSVTIGGTTLFYTPPISSSGNVSGSTLTSSANITGTNLTISTINGTTNFQPGTFTRSIASTANRNGTFQVHCPTRVYAPEGGGFNVVCDVNTGQLNLVVSSINFKTNVTELDQELTSKVLNLNARQWYPKLKDAQGSNLSSSERQRIKRRQKNTGLIAEEVHDVYPGFAILNTQNEPVAIDWQAITAMLIEEVKSLRKDVDALQVNSV